MDKRRDTPRRRFTPGAVKKHADDIYSAAIDDKNGFWYEQITVNAATKEEAMKLRRKVLRAINA